ncbi:MAG: phosphotransferase [Deltaproteobacteria bacterium]|nr:phosphotransferase [Deltaproteobacteria bacterium]
MSQVDDYQPGIREILSEGYSLDGTREAVVKRIDSGRVNETYLVSVNGGQDYIFQRLNALFGAAEAIGENWSRVGEAVSGIGAGFPRIRPSKRTGWLYRPSGGLVGPVWRLTDFLPGRPPSRKSKEEARLSARAMGLYHVALNVPKPIELLPSLESGDFTNQRRCSPEDFEIINSHYRGHPNLASLATDISRGTLAARNLPNRPSYVRVFAVRDLVIHKDCKVSNFLVDAETVSLIDWDTVGYGDPLLDIGEMCRSWAVSPVAPLYDADLAAAIVDGYRQGGLRLTKGEYQLLPAVVRGLSLNLARRYLIDALAESYFKWDKDSYPSLYEQNKSRGHFMLDLVEELLDREIELMKI